MPPRPLDLLDLPTLYRFRDSAVPLDTTRLLTRGNPLGAGGFLSYFNPARHLYTAISVEDGTTLLGGVIHTNGDLFARLVYLAPLSTLDHPSLPPLIEHLCAEAGGWGAFHVLAEVDESSEAFVALRKSGFSVYAWQRVWDVSHITPGGAPGVWVRAQAVNLPSVQSLYHQIVPPLLQPVESMPKHPAGLICAEGARCYVSLAHGLSGIVLTPLIHPEAQDVPLKLAALLNHLPDRHGRHVYLCVRSYQTWLEPVLADLGAKPSLRQAVMVKHLARQVKEEQMVRAAQPTSVIPASRITHVRFRREK